MVRILCLTFHNHVLYQLLTTNASNSVKIMHSLFITNNMFNVLAAIIVVQNMLICHVPNSDIFTTFTCV